MRGTRGTVCVVGAILVSPICFVTAACVSEASPDNDAGATLGDGASEAALGDAAKDAGADVVVPCDASPPSTAAFSVACGDAGSCDSHTNACCFDTLPFKCQSTGTCTTGFFCDKSSDCTSGNICCASIGSPSRSTCPLTSTTSSGSTCTQGSVCGIGQVELCVKDQACKDTSKTCTLVDMTIGVNGFDLDHHMIGACL